jgi:hypothetical protein
MPGRVVDPGARHLTQRLVADGETVINVPARLSARARVFSTGQGRRTDPADAHSVAVVALHTTGLRTPRSIASTGWDQGALPE